MLKAQRLKAIARPFTSKGWGHWLRFAFLLALASLGGHLLSTARWLTPLRYAIYHRQMLMRDRSQLYPTRTALVLLDDVDYWSDRFQARTPLKRDQLAAILDSLRGAGVNTVAFDVDLRSPFPKDGDREFKDYTDEDAAFIRAIGRMCDAGRHVVLASSVTFGADGYEELPSIYTKSLSTLPCVARGYIQLPFDMRRLPGPLDVSKPDPLNSLSLAMVNIADPTAYGRATEDDGHGFRFSEYLTQKEFESGTGRKYEFTGADLSSPDGKPLTGADLNKLRDQLADKLVIVGAKWHANAYGNGPRVDEFNSPGGIEPGAMLHANYVEAMLDRTGTFGPVADSTAEILEIALALVLAMIGVLEIHTAWKWAAFGIGIVFSVIFTYTLLQNLGIFLDFFIPMLMIIVHTLVEEVLKAWHELQHLKQAHEENREHTHAAETAEG